MGSADTVAFNICTFISALFLLEFGADKFIDHTAIVSRRIGVSQALVGLLTAGAEWEELAVVVSALSLNRPSLAIGNVIGSAISNILGAFSLGLLFHSSNDAIEFDNSAKIYSALSLALTTFATFVVYFAQAGLWKVFGGILIALFVVYIGSVVWAISKGRMKAPELSDDEDSDESDGEGAIVREAAAATSAWAEEDGEETPLLNGDPDPPAEDSRAPEQQPEPESGIVSQHAHHGHSLLYHVGFLVLGFVCLTLASYVLSHSASSLTTALGISDVLFGVIILSIATTLPEKFVAVLAGHRGHRGILVANTVGSNMFLLSLCLGIVMLHTGGEFDERKGRGNVNVVELGVLWVSSLTFAATVWLGTGKWSKWIGSVMLGCYVVFLVLEFVIVRSVIAA